MLQRYDPQFCIFCQKGKQSAILGKEVYQSFTLPLWQLQVWTSEEWLVVSA